MVRIPGVVSVVAIVFAMTTRPSAALDPKTRVTQYRHSAWRVQNGAFESAPNAIAQTPDGYIWIGTNSGLVRFDGVRFQRWILPDTSGVPRVWWTALVSGNTWRAMPMSTKLSTGRVHTTYAFTKRSGSCSACRCCVGSSAWLRAANTSGCSNRCHTEHRKTPGCSG